MTHVIRRVRSNSFNYVSLVSTPVSSSSLRSISSTFFISAVSTFARKRFDSVSLDRFSLSSARCPTTRIRETLFLSQDFILLIQSRGYTRTRGFRTRARSHLSSSPVDCVERVRNVRVNDAIVWCVMYKTWRVSTIGSENSVRGEDWDIRV